VPVIGTAALGAAAVAASRPGRSCGRASRGLLERGHAVRAAR